MLEFFAKRGVLKLKVNESNIAKGKTGKEMNFIYFNENYSLLIYE